MSIEVASIVTGTVTAVGGLGSLIALAGPGVNALSPSAFKKRMVEVRELGEEIVEHGGVESAEEYECLVALTKRYRRIRANSAMTAIIGHYRVVSLAAWTLAAALMQLFGLVWNSSQDGWEFPDWTLLVPVIVSWVAVGGYFVWLFLQFLDIKSDYLDESVVTESEIAALFGRPKSAP